MIDPAVTMAEKNTTYSEIKEIPSHNNLCVNINALNRHFKYFKVLLKVTDRKFPCFYKYGTGLGISLYC